MSEKVITIDDVVSSLNNIPKPVFIKVKIDDPAFAMSIIRANLKEKNNYFKSIDKCIKDCEDEEVLETARRLKNNCEIEYNDSMPEV